MLFPARLSTERWAESHGKMSGGGLHSAAWATVITLNSISVITLVSPILAAFGIIASPSRLFNEVLDAYHHASGIETPRRRVKLAPRVVIRRLDGKE